MTKVCSTCEITKDLKEFHKNKNSKDGLVYHCKVCVAIKQKRRYGRVKFNKLAGYVNVFANRLTYDY